MIRLSYIKFIFLISLFIITGRETNAQSCGFGCFGLSGFFVGFGMQKYSADGLNDYVAKYRTNPSSTVSAEPDKFEKATGFRLGVNLFRMKYSDFLVSAKGYYQFQKEENSLDEIVNNQTVQSTFSLNMNYWAVGFDVGYSLFNFLDLKIVDASVSFHSAELNIQSTPAGAAPEKQLLSDKTKIGYSLGSGLIIKLVGDYISVEATASYNKYGIDRIEGDDIYIGQKNANEAKFISDGGISGAVQLNIGIPLY